MNETVKVILLSLYNGTAIGLGYIHLMNEFQDYAILLMAFLLIHQIILAFISSRAVLFGELFKLVKDQEEIIDSYISKQV